MQGTVTMTFCLAHDAAHTPLPGLSVVSWLGMTPDRIDCHVFALDGGESGVLLVDCGTPWGHDRIVRNMTACGLAAADVRTILLTHSHVDHVAGGWLFKRRGAEILSHRDILTDVECQWEAQAPVGNNSQPETWRIDGHLADGDEISRCGFDIRVFGTSGHTSGCLSYLIDVNDERCLFTGDLIMDDGLPGWHGDPGFSMTAIIASMQRLLTVSFDHLCFGHGLLLNDRGALFRRSLERYQAGDWTAPGSRLMSVIGGRAPARR